jgi:hypothetical protein
VGQVDYDTTERTDKGKLVLQSLVYDELTNVHMLKIEAGEDIAEFTGRLQIQERYIRWVVSTILQDAAEAQLLQMADTQFFKLLKNHLPDRMEYMGSDVSKGFAKLCSMVLESVNQKRAEPKKELVKGKAVEAKPGAGECWNFARGSCTRGSSCRFEHINRGALPSDPQNLRKRRQESPPPRGMSSGSLCFDFQRGKCRRDASCRYVHSGEGRSANIALPSRAGRQGK